MTAPYPLAWPEELPRTGGSQRSKFRTQLAGAMQNVRQSLRLFATETGGVVSNVVIRSNFTLGIETPDDPGVAVWFVWEGEQRCIAVDRYGSVRENLQAIHHVLEARRTEMRHAGIVMVRATFKGFTALLPAPDCRAWWMVLGTAPSAGRDEVQAAYKVRARHAAQAGA